MNFSAATEEPPDEPPAQAEEGVPLDPLGRMVPRAADLRIALCYPNTYSIGMANLGLHTMYELFNNIPGVACERVFLPDAEEMLLKSQIVMELSRLIRRRKLTQTAAAKLIGIGQPDLSNLLRGRFRGYSAERLMRMLTAFDRDVVISVRPHRKRTGQAGRIRFRVLTEHDGCAGPVACVADLVDQRLVSSSTGQRELRWVIGTMSSWCSSSSVGG